jgi:general secretion pathway protein F
MTQFSYVAKTGSLKTIHGFIEAESAQEAIVHLGNSGYFPVSLEEAGVLTSENDVLNEGKVSRTDVAVFTDQLAGLLGSGVVALNALSILLKQTSNKHLKAVIGNVIEQVRDGRSLSQSFASHPLLFSNLYIAMLHSGEMSGRLEQSMMRLAGFLEKDQEFRSSVRSALIYPLFILCVGSATVFLLLTFVIPRLVTMFKDMGQALPMPTQILIGISEFWHAYWPLIGMFIFGAVIVFKRWVKSPQGKPVWDRARLKFPLAGEIILKTEIARLMQTLALLVGSGMEILQAIEI